MQITTVKLDGTNYLEWFQSAIMYISGRGKLGYINGQVVEPSAYETVAYEKWESENLTVMLWLVHSMQLGMGFLFLRTAKEIWDSTAQTYPQVKNFVRACQLNQEIVHLHQGEKSLGS